MPHTRFQLKACDRTDSEGASGERGRVMKVERRRPKAQVTELGGCYMLTETSLFIPNSHLRIPKWGRGKKMIVGVQGLRGHPNKSW